MVWVMEDKEKGVSKRSKEKRVEQFVVKEKRVLCVKGKIR